MGYSDILPQTLDISGTQSELGVYTKKKEDRTNSLPSERGWWERKDQGLGISIIKCHLPSFIVQIDPDLSGAPTQGQVGNRGGEGLVIGSQLLYSPDPRFGLPADLSHSLHGLSGDP